MTDLTATLAELKALLERSTPGPDRVVEAELRRAASTDHFPKEPPAPPCPKGDETGRCINPKCHYCGDSC